MTFLWAAPEITAQCSVQFYQRSVPYCI